MIYIKKDEVKPTNLFNGFYKPITKNLLIYRKDIKNLYIDMEEKNIEIFLKNGYKDEVKPTNLFNGFYKPITKNLLIYRKDIKNLYIDMEEKNIEIFLKNGY